MAKAKQRAPAQGALISVEELTGAMVRVIDGSKLPSSRRELIKAGYRALIHELNRGRGCE